MAVTVLRTPLSSALARFTTPPVTRGARAPATPTGTYSIHVPGIQYSPGACLAFTPLGRPRHRTVFIDPGHGGPDPGAVGTATSGQPVEEKTLTLASGLALMDLLRRQGYLVVMSRTMDTSVTVLGPGDFNGNLLTIGATHLDAQAITACADQARADLFVSIHFDADSDPAAGGAETIYDDARPFSPASRGFAALIQADLIQQFAARGWTVPDRGVLADSQVNAPALSPQGAAYGHFLVIGPASPGLMPRPSEMPGALTEPLFVTRPIEADVASSPGGREAIAAAIAEAVNQYFQQPTE